MLLITLTMVCRQPSGLQNRSHVRRCGTASHTGDGDVRALQAKAQPQDACVLHEAVAPVLLLHPCSDAAPTAYWVATGGLLDCVCMGDRCPFVHGKRARMDAE